MSLSTARQWYSPAIAVQALVLFALALGLRLVNLDNALSGNEMFHLMAAQSWATESTFRVAHGAYTRNGEFTVLISWLTGLFGESPVVARMPAVAAGSATVSVLFVWVAYATNRNAAWIAALLLCVSPLAIDMSQWVRAYTILSLAFLLGSVGIYSLVVNRMAGRAAGVTAIVSAFFIGIAVKLHILVIIGVAGLALWVVSEYRTDILNAFGRIAKSRVALILLGIGLAFLFAVVIGSGVITDLLRIYRDLQPQAAGRQTDILFYHKWLIGEYPLLWGAVPVAVIVAIARRSSFGLFCACIFFTVFFVYCFASRKWLRYIYYVTPFLFAIWGFVLALAIPPLKRLAHDVAGELNIGANAGVLRRSLVGLILAATVLFLAGTNAILRPVYQHLTAGNSAGPNWPGARRALEPWLRDPRAVVVASPMQPPLYHYGRADIEFGAKYVYESNTGEEFGIDHRTGLRVVSTPASINLVFDCYARGVLLMPTRRWRKPGFGPTDDVYELLQEKASPLVLNKEWGVTAFAWDGGQVRTDRDCSLLRPLNGEGSSHS